MEISLKDKLRTLRQQKNVTQEALANHLGITPQSVGKWERGEGFPDITLLPKIAFYFDITVDELLGVEQARVEEEIAEYQRRSNIYCHNGENQKNLELWEKAYSEYQNDCRVIEGLMSAINGDAVYPCPKDDAERKIALAQELLEKTTDSEQRESAIQTLCYTYDSIDKEKALHYADMFGSFYATKEYFRAHILDGEEGVEACQRYIKMLILQASLTAMGMTVKVDFSHEEIIEAFRFAIDILKRLYSDGNIGHDANMVSYYYRCIATEYAEMKDAESTLKALEDSTKYAVIRANLKDMDYTAPMVNRLKYKESNTSKNFVGNTCNLRLKDFNDCRFDFVRDDEAFKKIIAELEKNAE